MAEYPNGLRLKIYNFKKRRNSTKQPNEIPTKQGGDLALSTKCILKDKVNIYAPQLIIAVNHDSYTIDEDKEYTDAEYLYLLCNYAHFMGRYFWIEELVCNSQDHWELTLQSDPLATYKTWIGNTKVFAEYWNSGNIEFIDSRLPRRTNGSSGSQSWATGMDSTWFFMIGVIGNSGISYYKIGAISLAQLLINVSDNVEATISQIEALKPKDYTGSGSTSNDDKGGLKSLNVNNIANALHNSTEWLVNSLALLINNAMNNKQYSNYIVSLKFFPNSFSEINSNVGTSEHIYLGAFDTGASGERLLNFNPVQHEVEETVSKSAVPNQQAWGRRDGLMNWSLYIPYMGTLNIPNDIIVAGSSKIVLTYRVDLRTGDMFMKVGIKAFASAQSSITLASNTVAFGTNCLFGESHANTAGMALGAIGMTAGLVFGGTTSALNSIGADMGLNTVAGQTIGKSMAKSTANSLRSAAIATTASATMFSHSVTPTFNAIGGSGGVGLNPSNHTGMCCLSWYSFDVSESEVVMGPVLGVPKFGITTVKNCGGYVKASGASVEIPTATGNEIDTINSFLNSGLYYE